MTHLCGFPYIPDSHICTTLSSLLRTISLVVFNEIVLVLCSLHLFLPRVNRGLVYDYTFFMN